MKRQLDIDVVYIHGIEIVPLVTVRQSQKIHMQRSHRCLADARHAEI
jgi:hypothetical protein